jgi:hypothetical protein
MAALRAANGFTPPAGADPAQMRARLHAADGAHGITIDAYGSLAAEERWLLTVAESVDEQPIAVARYLDGYVPDLRRRQWNMLLTDALIQLKITVPVMRPQWWVVAVWNGE